jgi:hypothetical protein
VAVCTLPVTNKSVLKSWMSWDFSKASAFIKTIINEVENAKQKDKI